MKGKEEQLLVRILRLDRRLRKLEKAAWVLCVLCEGKGEMYGGPGLRYDCYRCGGIGFKPYKEKNDE